MVAAIVVVGLAPGAWGQSASKPATHRAKPKVATVQPEKGAPPDQAVQQDQSAPLAQTPNYDPPPPPPRPPDPDPPPPAVLPQVAEPTPFSPIVPMEQLQKPPPVRSMTAEEQELERDSARMLTLAKELQDEVDKAGIDTLSLSALRKAEEIQRLSKNLKERLRLQAQVMPTKTQ